MFGARDRVGPFTIHVEDLSRPRTMGLKPGTKAIHLAKHLPKPKLFFGKTEVGGQALHRGHRSALCRRLIVPVQPAFLLKIGQPRDDLFYHLKSFGPVVVQVLGPMNKTGRNIPSTCLGRGEGKLHKLEPGVYSFKFGAKRGVVKYSFLFRTAKTKLSPLRPSIHIPTQLPLRQRMVTQHYPQLSKKFLRSTKTLQGLFGSAPKGLYLFPSFNLDKASAKPIPSQHETVAYPKKNEPLLLFANRWVVATDGSVFEVSRYSYLVTRPDGPISLPRAPRNSELSFSAALRNRGPEDERAIGALNRAARKEERCVERVRAPFHRRVKSLEQRAWSRGRDKRIQALKEQANTKAFRACGTEGLVKKREQLRQRLITTQTKRRAARLKKLRPRLQHLFR